MSFSPSHRPDREVVVRSPRASSSSGARASSRALERASLRSATETEAIDRTHRIGQTRNVMVYRLIAKDTIEEKVMAMKTRKADLFTSVLDDGNVFGSSLTADDIRGLMA